MKTTQDCSRWREAIRAWVGEGVAGEQTAQIQDHLATCAECRRYAEELRAAAAGLRWLADQPVEPSPGFRARWTRAVEEAARPRGFWGNRGGAPCLVARAAAAEPATRAGSGVVVDSGAAVPAQRPGRFSRDPGHRRPLARRNRPRPESRPATAGLALVALGPAAVRPATSPAPSAPERTPPCPADSAVRASAGCVRHR